MVDFDPSVLRLSFDEAADVYDRARPAYPEELFDDLFELAGVHRGAVVEIGPGTGRATQVLAARGFDVVGVELGAALAQRARANLAGFANARIVCAPFESWDPRGARFAMVFAAESWHWIDPQLRCAKAAALLAPGGALVIVGYVHAFPADGDPFMVELRDVYERFGELRNAPPAPDQIVEFTETADELAASGLFDDVVVRRYVQAQSYRADEFIDLLDTFSGHRVMERDTRQALYQDIRRRIQQRPSQRVRRHYTFILHVARPTRRSRS